MQVATRTDDATAMLQERVQRHYGRMSQSADLSPFTQTGTPPPASPADYAWQTTFSTAMARSNALIEQQAAIAAREAELAKREASLAEREAELKREQRRGLDLFGLAI